MSSSETRSSLPTGSAVVRTMPDRLFIAEMVFGGLVWILLISADPVWTPVLDWDLFSSAVCFLTSTVWLCVFCCGANESRIWLQLDVGYHVLATLMYLSTSISMAIITNALSAAMKQHHEKLAVHLKRFLAAMVFAFLTTILYFIHAVFSVMRSNRAPYTAI